MAFNEETLERIRKVLLSKEVDFQEKKMFMGVCIMVDDKMCVAVHTDEIMVRIDPALDEDVREMPGCKAMQMKGSDIKGYYFISDDVLKTKKQLDYWVQLALDYNKIAKSSKKKKAAKKK